MRSTPSDLNLQVDMPGTQGRVHRKVRRALWTVNHEETTKTLQNQLNVMAAEDRTRWNFDFEKNIPLNGQYQWSIMGTGSNMLHDKLTIAPSGTSTSRHTEQTTCQERLLQDLNFSAVPEVDFRCNTTSSPHPAAAVGTKCPSCSTRPLEHPDGSRSDYPATDKENHQCSVHNSARKEHTNSGDVINRLSGCYSFTEVRVTGSKRQHPITEYFPSNKRFRSTDVTGNGTSCSSGSRDKPLAASESHT